MPAAVNPQIAEQTAAKQALDQRVVEQRAARQQLGEVEATAEGQLAAIAERTGPRREALRGRRAPLDEAVTDFKTKLDALPEDVRQATVQIHATHRDATTAVAGSKANTLKTADEVKTTGRKLRASKKHRTTPRTPGGASRTATSSCTPIWCHSPVRMWTRSFVNR